MSDIYIELVEHLGDIIACEPVSRYLREKNPNKKIYWVVNKRFKDAIIANPYINGIIEVNDLYVADRFCEQKRQEGDEIVDLHFDGRIDEQTGHKHKNLSKITEEIIYQKETSLLSSFCQIAGLPALNEAPIFYLKTDDKTNEGGGGE